MTDLECLIEWLKTYDGYDILGSLLVLDWIPLILISFSVNIFVISTSSPGLS